MIISRTPYRISLFGGGTDYPAWFEKHGGSVLGFCINKYCYISVRRLPPFFEHRHRVVYSIVENVNHIGEIQHPAVRAVLEEIGIDYGIEIHHDGDLPARSGMGSSSSFTVGLLNSLKAQAGEMVSRRWLAEEAIRIEQDVIGEHVGSQDQVWASYGGMNRVDFAPDGSFSVHPLIMHKARREELTGNFMLFFTGLSRIASTIAAKKIENLEKKERSVHRIRDMVDEAQAILGNPAVPLVEIGKLLHESWCLKKDLADAISTDQINGIYEAGRKAGAVGGKLLGAGGGGFMLLYVEPDHRRKVREALKNLIEVQFELDNMGSKIVVYEPDGLEMR